MATAGGRRRSAAAGRSPSWCTACGAGPQYERGFPEYCERPSPRLERNIMTSMLDLMPAPAG